MSQERVSLVTGGAQGIGYAIGAKLAKDGHRIALADIQHDRAMEAANSISEQTGAEVIACHADVTSPSSVAEMVAEVRSSFGRIDVLVNNAGIITTDYALAENADIDHFDRMISTHVRGAFLSSAQVIGQMKEQRYGRIFMISSLVGPLGFSRRIGYSTAKTAVLGMMRTLAVEGARANVNVNTVNPGYILTDAIAERISAGELNAQALLTRIPAGRWGSAQDIAGVIAGLLAPEFDYVTGTEVPVDGGYRIYGDYTAGADGDR